MNKKGFTLIELLAVIVIVAIVSLVAVPSVLNIIEDSRKGAAEASARNIVSAAKTYYMSETMNGRTPGSIDLSTDTLKYDGDQATKGTITFTDGKPEAKMYISGYCVEVAVDGKVTSEKKAEDECEVTATPSEPTVTYKKYNNGDYVFFNPKDNVKCEAATSSATGTNDTCMKWYAFLDSEDSSTVNLILDHNTTGYVEWNSNSSGTTPETSLSQLATDITNWNAAVKSTARLISASEVNQIAPTAEGFTWTETNINTWYYLHNGNQTQYKGAAGRNRYAWLFDNTDSCTTYGCNIANSAAYGYWTSSFASSGYAWGVDTGGRLNYRGVSGAGYGVRPVITVPKSIFTEN